MRKRGLTGLIALLVVLGAFASTALAAEYSYVKTSLLAIGDKIAYVNEQEITLDAAPYVNAKAGKTLVPLRFMEDALGAEIKWDKITRTATLKTPDTEVKVTIGQKTAYVNGEAVALDVPVEIKNNRTFVPLRFISENLGAVVEYDAETKTIGITYINKNGWKEFTEPANNLFFLYPNDWTVVSSDKSNLKLKSSVENIMEFKIQTGDLATVLKEKRDTYSKNGWEIQEDQFIFPDDANFGSTIGSIKGDESKPEEIQIYYAYIFKLEKTVYTWEFTANLANYEPDATVFYDIWNNM